MNGMQSTQNLHRTRYSHVRPGDSMADSSEEGNLTVHVVYRGPSFCSVHSCIENMHSETADEAIQLIADQYWQSMQCCFAA